MAPPRSDFYESLGIERDASQEQIRKAYRRRALETHPDRLPNGANENEVQAASEQFRRVNNAYEVLSNEENRKLYDQHGVWPPPKAQTTPQNDDDFFYQTGFDPHYQSRYRNNRHYHEPRRGHSFPFGPDPFFSGFGNRSEPNGFSDPFEIFNSVFREMDDAFREMDAHMNGRVHRSFGGSPRGFPAFGPSVFDHTPLFARNVNAFHGDPFFSPFGNSLIAQSMLDESGPARSRPFNGMRFASTEIRSQTINGVTTTEKRRIDSDGNERITRTYPDGRKVRYLNGVEQSPTYNHIEYHKHPSDSNGGSLVPEKKKWWRGW